MALGVIARAQGTTKVGKDLGRFRERHYMELTGERSSSFNIILKDVSALGRMLGASVRS